MNHYPLQQVNPRYGNGSLSDLLPSVLALMGVPGETDRLALAGSPIAQARRYAVLLLDGFGFHLLDTAKAASATWRQIKRGELGHLGSLTTNLPSTTPVSLASMGSGTTPGDHGIVGFTVRVPESHDLLVHIYWNDEPDPFLWQPRATCFERARAQGIYTAAVSPGRFSDSGVTRSALRGADYYPADNPSDCASQMVRALEQGQRSLVFGYLPQVDTAGHRYGVGSVEWLDEVSAVSKGIDQLLDTLPDDTALLVTADHGMINVDYQIHLDDFPHLWDGVDVVAGDPRMRYLYTADGATEDTIAAWRDTVGEYAEVLARDEAIARGWFGPTGDVHAERIGNVVVACQGTSGILGATGEPASLPKLIGHHGGYTASEMMIPLWKYIKDGSD